MRLQFVCVAAGVLIAGLTPERTSAQPSVELCEAPWIDAERVHALLAVELGGVSAASGIRVGACTDDSAQVVVRFGEEPASARESELDLRQTPVGARSRLVALVIAELVRLGSRSSSLGAPEVDSRELAGETDQEAAPVQEEATSTQAARLSEAEATNGVDALLDEEPSTDAGGDASPAEVADPVIAADPISEPEPPAEPPSHEAVDDSPVAPDRCEAWRRFGRGPCSWTVGLSYGVGFHQLGLLGESRVGTTFNHQLRLVGRWRYLFGGVRVYASGAKGGGAADLITGGATAMAGLEWWARRWSKNILALRTGIEAGLHGFQSTGPIDFCGIDCGHSEPVVGAFTSVRFERLFGLLRAAVELEVGWSTGFRIDDEQTLITGLGGPWFSLTAELSIGRKEG